ncbi:MAG: beta-ketoacyl-[acyl-carrier-protein] synthase II, partial [Gammaproteobacteria bacterium]|nr:beta-ketoacyl-[acyl-carrier-protein] synthase II [Gammaproteobacteria bacterium]
VGYINLHGTATPANDSSEDNAVTQLLPDVPCSSTKGWTGHTLGAAGIIEAIFSVLTIQHNLIPGSLNTEQLDPALTSNIQLKNKQAEVSYAMSNSFGFGGNNCSLLFGEQ